MSTSDMRRRSGKRWVVPAAAIGLGVVYLVAGLAGDDPSFGWGGLAAMLTVTLLIVVLSLGSETTAGLLDRRDERINSIDRDATVVAGLTLMAVVLGGFVLEIARGQDGQPYAALGAVAAVTYVATLVILRFRR